MSPDEVKKAVGFYAVNFVKHGMTIGLGSGSTVYWFIQELGKRVKQGLEIKAIPTSAKTKALATGVDIVVADLNHIDSITLTIDGADEIDPRGQLIKGGGGALLQEKIVAAASDKLIIIADSSKIVQRLGKFPLPVEVIPFGYKHVRQTIIAAGVCQTVTLRERNGEVFVTDHKHYILDCEFNLIVDPFALNATLHGIPGVVETGLFLDMADKAVIGYEDGRIELKHFR